MLQINDVKYQIIGEKIYIGTFNKSCVNGYNLCIQIEFINNGEKGYINLDFGYEKEKDINLFIYKEYINRNDTFYEIYDKEFYDWGFNTIIKINGVKDNQVNVSFRLYDELMNIEFNGYLDIDNNVTKETFMG